MNALDRKFLDMFPNGTSDVQWLDLGKKHNPTKVISIINNELSKDNLDKLIEMNKHDEIMDIALTAVKKVSVVSVFEKVAFTNYAKKGGNPLFSNCLFDFLYNYNQDSFMDFVEILQIYKSEKINPAKWPVVTFFKAYQNPDEFVFVKPTTVKKIAEFLEVDIKYSPTPNYNTYMLISDMIKDYRTQSDICKEENLMITQAILFTISL